VIRTGAGLLALTLAIAGCRDQGARPPAPGPDAPASRPDGRADGMKPLTSRDGGGDVRAPAGSLGSPLPPGHPAIDGPAPGRPAGDPTARVTGTIALASSLSARVTERDVLYVIARNAKTNAVVAVRREEGVRFPHSFTVSAADVMMEGSAFTGPFDITARVSRTGDAIPGPGDLEGTTKGIGVGQSGVSITIDSVRQ
jgi:cytochrome c-type biogenesis protein CcmH